MTEDETNVRAARLPASWQAGQRVSLLVILVLAFAVRCWGLTGQSLWSDEGISINRSLLPVGEMLARMPAEHAPGYFLLLGGWLRLAGSEFLAGDFALRFFSLVAGVVAVALLYRLGIDLARPAATAGWLALCAALLVALNPTLIWYAQEGRMYTWLFASAALSTLALWRILHPGNRARWGLIALYGVSTALTVYLHYYGALTPIAHALYVMIWALATRRWRAVGDWMIGAAVALLLFAPWIPRALGVFGFSGWREGGQVSDIPYSFAKAYLIGYTPQSLTTFAMMLFVAVAMFGAIWWIMRRSEAALLLLLWMAAPLATVVALALRNPDFHPRYTLYVVAPLSLFLAAGILGVHPAAWNRQSDQPRRGMFLVAPLLLLVCLVGANGAAIYRQQQDATLAKPDFRGAVERINEHLAAGDVVLADGPDPELVINHYYRGNAPLYDLRELEEATDEEVAAQLQENTAGGTRIWELLYFHDPAKVQVWTATQAFASAPTYHQGIRVTLYGLETPDLKATRLDLPIGDTLNLVTATVQSEATPGDLLRVRTEWFTHAQLPELRFSLRLVDAAGNTVTSDDYVPQNWFAPTNVWVPNAPARDQRALLLPASTAAGAYTVYLRLYDPATGVPVPTALGDDIPLGTVMVTP